MMKSLLIAGLLFILGGCATTTMTSRPPKNLAGVWVPCADAANEFVSGIAENNVSKSRKKFKLLIEDSSKGVFKARSANTDAKYVGAIANDGEVWFADQNDSSIHRCTQRHDILECIGFEAGKRSWASKSNLCQTQ